MKLLVYIFLVFSFTSTYAQGEYNYQFFHVSQEIDQREVPKGIQKLTYEVKTHKTGKIKKYLKEYNEEGKMTSSGFYKDEVLIYRSKNKFDENNLLIQQEYFNKKGKIRTKAIGVRNNEGMLIEYSRFKGESKLKTYSTWEYNSSSCISESVNYKKNKEDIRRKWSYDYYEECQKKQSTLTNGKGKVIQIWTYDCKEEGEEMIKKKDVTQMCKWEESDGEFLIKVTQSFNEKGELYKTVAKYTLVDTSLVNWKSYNDKNEIQSEATYNPELNRVLTYTFYKNGKVRSSQFYKYEGEHLISKSYTYKNNTTEYKYEYQDDRLTVLNVFSKDGELAKTTTYEYN